MTGMPWLDGAIHAAGMAEAEERHPETTFAEILEHAAAGDWTWFSRVNVQVTHPVIWQGIADLARRVEALERRAASD